MTSNYQWRKALYKQIKSKDLSVDIADGKFFRLVKLNDDTFLLNIDIQTDKGNITIKGLTKNHFNSYNTTSDIQLYVDTDNIVYVKNTSGTETTITSTSIELVKGILNESYFDIVTTVPESDRLSVNGTTTLGKLEIKGEDLTVEGTTKYDDIEAKTITGIVGQEQLLIQGPPDRDLTLSTDGKMVNIESNTSITGTLEVSGDNGIKIKKSSLVWDSESESLKFIFPE